MNWSTITTVYKSVWFSSCNYKNAVEIYIYEYGVGMGSNFSSNCTIIHNYTPKNDLPCRYDVNHWLCSIGQNLQPMHSYFNSEHLFCKDCWHILVMLKLRRIWNIPIKSWSYNTFSAFCYDGYCVIYIILPASVCFSDNSDKKSNK